MRRLQKWVVRRPVNMNAEVTMATAGTPCASMRIASSTLLELHDPQSPIPETTRSHRARSALMAASSIAWLGERLRWVTVTIIP